MFIMFIMLARAYHDRAGMVPTVHMHMERR